MNAADGHDGREGVGNGASVFLVNVGNLADRGADHGDGGETALLLLVIHELTPESEIGSDDGTPSFDVEIRLTQRHAWVGQNQVVGRHRIILFPTSSGVSE